MCWCHCDVVHVITVCVGVNMVNNVATIYACHHDVIHVIMMCVCVTVMWSV